MPIVNLPLAHLVRGVLKGKRKEITVIVLDRAPVEVAEITSTGAEDVLGYRASVTKDAFWMEVGSIALQSAAQVDNSTERLLRGSLRDREHLPVVMLPLVSQASKYDSVQVPSGENWRSSFSRVISSDRERRISDLQVQGRGLAFVDGHLSTSRLRPVGYASDRLLTSEPYSASFRDMLGHRFVSIFERNKGFNADASVHRRYIEIEGGGRLGGRLPGPRFDHSPFLALGFLGSLEGLDWPEDGMPLDAQGVFAFHRLKALRAIEKQGLAVTMAIEEVRDIVDAVVAGFDRSNLQDDLMLDAFDRAVETFHNEANNLSASQVPDCDLAALGFPQP